MSLVQDQPAIETAVPTRLDAFLGKWFGDRSRAAIRAGFWSGSGFVTSQLLRTGSRLLLARVLLPKSAFGIWTLLSGFISGLQMLSDVGIGPSIVQNSRGVEPRFLDTAFTIQVVRGAALWVIACLLAWPAAVFLEVPSLTYLIPVAALTLLVGGFVNTAFYSWTRNMHLRPVTLLNIGAELAGVVATVVVALISPTIWALVAGVIATSVVGAAGTYFWGLRRSRFGWEKAAAAALLHFGIGTFLSTATWFMASQGERFVLTKFLAMQKTHEVLEAMGDYGVAAMLAGTTTAAISQVVTQVFFPSISRAMRDSVVTATDQYRKARWLALVLILGVTLPLALEASW